MKRTLKLISALLMSFSGMAQTNYATIGQVIKSDAALDNLLASDVKIEVLASGFNWSEGPVWVKGGNYLLFSDVPANTIFKWKEGDIKAVPFLNPSGYTGILPYSNEPGSNGLIINKKGELVACEHGDRRISAMPLNVGGKKTLADNFQGKRFNSPNDIVQHSGGAYYFTDPPYGLPQHEKDPTRETPVFGVYRIGTDGVVSLEIDNLVRPNGLAFSVDEKTLYVAQSDFDSAVIMAYPVLDNGKIGKGKVFFDATPMVKQGLKGLPDGLKIDKNGNIFTTGPGGILILSPQGRLLGRIDTGEPTSNCNWGDDGSTLYITANMFLCRIKTKTKGNGW
ncbi:gluconolactonase [Pseudarcicella hirudinis]|uniref:Gluconolactonase n=1 Tax=Pseudarcicella hirudinis TaxID=1079859 RepID=A0A1I5QR15_9BACT|nr:SMP-30/gluconolactonase/LRE family protein [Pseudarcicella hirudinis]SFP48709.1 gluconolactonase [Pseudarcicella hirudinis]